MNRLRSVKYDVPKHFHWLMGASTIVVLGTLVALSGCDGEPSESLVLDDGSSADLHVDQGVIDPAFVDPGDYDPGLSDEIANHVAEDPGVTDLDEDRDATGDINDHPSDNSGDLGFEDVCTPDCDGRQCGENGCGGMCGTCSGSDVCNTAGACVPSACTKDCGGRICGADPVCGESCGTCSGSDVCNTAGACVPASGEMITVAAGLFLQGCNAAVVTDCAAREKPYHKVNVPEFEIDKYEVTVALYRDCVDDGGCSAPAMSRDHDEWCNWDKSRKEEHPVNCVSWNDARDFCEWAGKRLCSESEWEKASRGTDGRKYPWGNEAATCEYAVMDDGENGCGTASTWPVGSKPAGASPFGVQDMSGNVWEWVEDDWHGDYTGSPTDGSAWVDSPRGSGRVGRGGGFTDSDAGGYLRSSFRYGVDSAYADYLIGVRCCRSK